MKRRFLMGVVTAGLVMTMTVPAFATTQVNTTFNFETSFTQEGTTKGTIQDMLNSITSNPTVPKLNMKLFDVMTLYYELMEKYDSATSESDKKAVLNKLTEIVNAIHEVIPDLTLIEYDNIINGKNPDGTTLTDLLSFFEREGTQLGLNKSLAPYFVNGKLVKPELELDNDKVQEYNIKLSSIKTTYTNATTEQKKSIKDTLSFFQSTLESYKNNETVLVTLDSVFSGVETEPPKEEQAKVTSFSDVPTSHWGNKDIMAMKNKGLFSGTGKIVNGVGVFSPENTMKRSEFITVVMRALYNDELSKMPSSGGQWWENSYDLAVEKGILKSNELDNGAMDQGMSRQEMALVLVRATEQLGQSPSQLVSTGRIADYNTIGTYYKDYVVKAYSMGMLAGTDAKGTYAPQATMNRAQGAVTLNRLVDSASRIKVDFSVPSNPVSSSIIIYEGQARSNRPAQAGDTFVKADGTKIVLQKDQYGIVGGGQGVAPDIGLNYNGEVCKDQGTFTYDNRAVSFTDSLGKELNNQTYMINRTTGTGHWGSEWQYLRGKISAPTSPGSKDGEVSKDAYHLYQWDSIMELWMDNY